MERKCKVCNNLVIGRKDKLFCSVRCKNYYHVNLRKVTEICVKEIDTILHRNRSILLEFMGKRRAKITIDRIALEKKKFVFTYHTHTQTNSKGKVYYYVYDFSWMEFSDDKILIIRKPQFN